MACVGGVDTDSGKPCSEESGGDSGNAQVIEINGVMHQLVPDPSKPGEFKAVVLTAEGQQRVIGTEFNTTIGDVETSINERFRPTRAEQRARRIAS